MNTNSDKERMKDYGICKHFIETVYKGHGAKLMFTLPVNFACYIMIYNIALLHILLYIYYFKDNRLLF